MPYETSATPFFDARFSDGKTAAAEDVRVALSSNGIVIRKDAASPQFVWSYATLSTAEPLSSHAIDALVSNSQQPGASLFVPHGAFARELGRLAPHLTTRAARRRAALPWLLSTLGVIAVAVIISMADFSPAHTLAELMPETIRKSLGEQTVRSITNDRKACSSPNGDSAIQSLVTRLTKARKGDPAALKVVVVEWDLVNAFATPGNKIVLTRGLIAKAQSPDEVAGVLAHEMGHAQLLHPETALVRVIGMSAAVELMLGGGSGTLANLGVLLTQLSYTRTAEQEADEAALELLEQSGISAKGFGEFFRRVYKMEDNGDKGAPKRGGLFDILQTHPPTQDRIHRVDAAKIYPSTPALTPSEWQALKTICAVAPD